MLTFLVTLFKSCVKLLSIYTDNKIWIMGILGFSSGLPLLLTGSTLVIRLDSLGITYTKIGLLSIATLPYSFKFIWAPLIDKIQIPLFYRFLGRRRSWLFASQIILTISLFVISLIKPEKNLTILIFLVFIITFSSATQDIVILAYQAERLKKYQFGAGEAISIFGYRIGILISGAGSLYLSTFLNWNEIYFIMSLFSIIGIITTLLINEPNNKRKQIKFNCKSKLKNPQKNPNIIQDMILPFIDFIKKPQWYIIICIMIFYKLNDNLIGSMSNLFYLELGFSKIEIANASKIFGMWATIIGGLIGGIIISRIDILKSLLIFGLLHGVSILMYILLAKLDGGKLLLYTSITLENITGGMRTTALFAFQFTLCNTAYAATQLALLSSCVNFGRTICSSTSGLLIDTLGWINFFYLATLSTIPSLIPIILLLIYNKKTSKKKL